MYLQSPAPRKLLMASQGHCDVLLTEASKRHLAKSAGDQREKLLRRCSREFSWLAGLSWSTSSIQGTSMTLESLPREKRFLLMPAAAPRRGRGASTWAEETRQSCAGDAIRKQYLRKHSTQSRQSYPLPEKLDKPAVCPKHTAIQHSEGGA